MRLHEQERDRVHVLAPFTTKGIIDSGLVAGVPREQKMLKGHLIGVIHHHVYFTSPCILVNEDQGRGFGDQGPVGKFGGAW